MRKRACLAVLGVSIVVAAVSLGLSLTRYIGLRAFSPKGAARTAPSPAAGDIPSTPVEEWNNPFAPGDGMKMASRLPAANSKSASQAPRSAFILVGTIVSSTPSARRAILWANGMKEPKAFRVKDEVEPGAVLASVERDKVWITRGKVREKLEILPVGSRARSPGTDSPTVASAGPQPAPSAGNLSRPGAASSQVPSSERTQPLVVAPATSQGDEDDESPSPRERRRGSRGYRR